MIARLILRYEEHPNERFLAESVDLQPNGDVLGLDDDLGSFVEVSINAANEIEVTVRVPLSATPPGDKLPVIA